MDNHGSTGTGAVTLYELAAGNLGAMKSDDFFTSGYRNGQVVQVDTRINNPNTKTSTVGTWTAGVDKLSFDISGLVGTSLWNEVSSSKKLAIHWVMTCANDVVSGVIDVDVETGEGPSVNVPEPGILALLCSGLGGLVWSRRRKLAK